MVVTRIDGHRLKGFCGVMWCGVFVYKVIFFSMISLISNTNVTVYANIFGF